jgi:hypothetical protein
MIIKVLKKFYEDNKRSNLFFRIIHNRKVTVCISRKYKARIYKTNITDSSLERHIDKLVIIYRCY